MKIIEINSADKRQVKSFINLPFSLYENNRLWTPPLEPDIKKVFNRNKHPFYANGEAAFYLALDDDEKPIGRIAVLDNRKFNQYYNRRTAFFYLFECVNSQDVSRELFQRCFDWAKLRNLDTIFGPKGFTVFDGLGLLVKGYEHQPAFGLPYNHSYYEKLISDNGFKPERDLLSGYLDRDFVMPEKILEIANLVKERRGYSISRFNTRRELRKILPNIKDLYNNGLREVGNNPPLTDQEIKSLADQLIWFADPKLIKIVMKNDLPVGFLFTYPDISRAVRETKGKIFPFGWIKLLHELKNTEWLNLNGAGIIKEHRGLGATALLFTEIYNSVKDSTYNYADLVQIGAENSKMLRELRDLGINFYKTHRVYLRELY